MAIRTPIEELDLSIGAYNALKANGVNFVDEIPALLAAEIDKRNRNLGRFRHEIDERLRSWGGDDYGLAGVPAR